MIESAIKHFPYWMFDGVVHNNVILANGQPGAQSDDIAILQGFGAFPLKREREKHQHRIKNNNN